MEMDENHQNEWVREGFKGGGWEHQSMSNIKEVPHQSDNVGMHYY